MIINMQSTIRIKFYYDIYDMITLYRTIQKIRMLYSAAASAPKCTRRVH